MTGREDENRGSCVWTVGGAREGGGSEREWRKRGREVERRRRGEGEERGGRPLPRFSLARCFRFPSRLSHRKERQNGAFRGRATPYAAPGVHPVRAGVVRGLLAPKDRAPLLRRRPGADRRVCSRPSLSRPSLSPLLSIFTAAQGKEGRGRARRGQEGESLWTRASRRAPRRRRERERAPPPPSPSSAHPLLPSPLSPTHFQASSGPAKETNPLYEKRPKTFGAFEKRSEGPGAAGGGERPGRPAAAALPLIGPLPPAPGPPARRPPTPNPPHSVR